LRQPPWRLHAHLEDRLPQGRRRTYRPAGDGAVGGAAVNLAALVEYDGTRFAGFQRQSPDKGPTVQGEIEAALQRIAGAAIAIEGAGRTDSGVHATGQVCNAHVPKRLDPTGWRRALNALLPGEIAIRAVCVVPDDFSARRSALARSYRYRILCDATRAPLREPY